MKESGDNTLSFFWAANLADVVDPMLEGGSWFNSNPLLELIAFSISMRFRMGDDFRTVTGALFLSSVFIEESDAPIDFPSKIIRLIKSKLSNRHKNRK